MRERVKGRGIEREREWKGEGREKEKTLIPRKISRTVK